MPSQVDLRESFRLGLRPSAEAPRDSLYLAQCQNMKPSPDGLVNPLIGLVDANVSLALGLSMQAAPWNAVTISWPYPQLLVGRSMTIIATETLLGTFDVSGGPPVVTNIIPTDVSTGAPIGAIPGGHTWHMADFGPVVLLFNGSCVVIGCYTWSGGTPTYGWWIDTGFVPRTGCNFRGRLLLGGFQNPMSDMANATNGTFLEDHWTSLSGDAGIVLTGDSISLTERHVWWSSITGQDLLQWFMPDAVANGFDITPGSSYDGTDNIPLETLWATNQQGFKAMPWQGAVQRVIPMEEGVLVLSDGGVGALVPIPSPTPTFAFRHVCTASINNYGACAGDSQSQAFVDRDGRLWTVDAAFRPTCHRYDSILKDWLEYSSPGGTSYSIIYGLFDPIRREFYFSADTANGDGLCTLILTATGVGIARLGVCGIVLLGNNYVYFEPGDTDAVAIETETFDFGNRGVDTIGLIETALTGTATTTLTVKARTACTGDFYESDPFVITRSNKSLCNISGIDMKVAISADDYANLSKLDYVKLMVSSEGRRRLGTFLRR